MRVKQCQGTPNLATGALDRRAAIRIMRQPSIGACHACARRG